MPTREQLKALVDELKHLKEEGVDTLYLSEASLEILERWKGRGGRRETPSLEAGLERKTDSHLSLKEEAPVVKPRKSVVPDVESKRRLPPPPEVVLPEGEKAARWEALRDQVLNCPTCNAAVKPGEKVVFGVGNVDAEVFFCGEAPGADEELQGEPFVGPAGQLLTKIIQTMGLSREEVYIGNIMNWRPDNGKSFGNRPPTAEEMAFCLPYLKAQVAIVEPKVIVALGATAVRGLQGLSQNPRMGDLRGKWSDYEGTPLMVTYHPSYLLRNQSLKRKREVWEDMLLVMEKLEMPISEKQRGYFLK